MKMAIGIDPGFTGAICLTDGKKVIEIRKMPVMEIGGQKEVEFRTLREWFTTWDDSYPEIHVFLERAVPFAMGTKSAFNYGRGFAMVEMAIADSGFSYTLVEPNKWTKVMHAGIRQDLKPKVRSEIAVKRLFPKWVSHCAFKKGAKLHDGAIDALLIAGFGLRLLAGGIV